MVAAALILLSASLSTVPATGETFRGVLEPNLTPSSGLVATLERVTEAPVNVPIPDGAAMFAGSLLPMGAWQFRVLLVEPRSQTPFMFIDTDLNGVFGSAERFSFSPTRHPLGRRRIRVALPPPRGSLFGHIPLELVLADDRLPAPPNQRYVLQSIHYATAKVRIDGQSYFFRYSIQPDTGTIDPSYGYHLVDRGRLNTDWLSPWYAWGRGQPSVFRIGHRYVATTAVDPTTRTVIIETKTASDYTRLELSRGLLIPDFSFYDSQQRTYRLSDYRGRFVLINVWSPGCGPCEDQFQFLRAAAARFGQTDLTILGLSQGYPREGHFWDISPASPPVWIEAEPQSVRRLLDDWFQITATPTPILLDREGRIAVLERRADGKRPLSGDELVQTLERVIRRSPAQDVQPPGTARHPQSAK
jgi:hypothetical protein